MLKPNLFFEKFWLNMFPMLMDIVQKHVINMQVDKKYRFSWNNVKCQLDATRCRATRTAPSAPNTPATQRLSRPPSVHKLSAGNHMLQLNIWCSWWCGYVPETCRAKNTSIKSPCYIKLAFHIISWGRCTFKQPSSYRFLLVYNDCILFDSDFGSCMHENWSEQVWWQ